MTRSLWKYFGLGFVALALIGSSVGCGDDDDTAPAAGKGGSSAAGKAGSSAKAGTSGGTAGKSAVTTAMCKATATTAVAEGGALASMACIDCACGEAADIVASCNKNCWGLIACVAAKCPTETGDALNTCVGMKCGAEAGAAMSAGISAAQMTGAILTGTQCKSSCVVVPPAPDASVPEPDASTPTPDAG